MNGTGFERAVQAANHQPGEGIALPLHHNIAKYGPEQAFFSCSFASIVV